jgi:hypothetical protein
LPRARADADRRAKCGPAVDQAFAALAAQLGGGVPDGLRRLEPDQLGDLTQAIVDTRRRHKAALAAGGERALGMIPRLLRGPIRRIVG